MSKMLKSNRNLLLINSIGGIGKTALAREYFHIENEKFADVSFDSVGIKIIFVLPKKEE